MFKSRCVHHLAVPKLQAWPPLWMTIVAPFRLLRIFGRGPRRSLDFAQPIWFEIENQAAQTQGRKRHALRQRSTQMGTVAWLVVGLIAGFIGSKIVNRSGEGLTRYNPRHYRRVGRRRNLPSAGPPRHDRSESAEYRDCGYWLNYRTPRLPRPNQTEGIAGPLLAQTRSSSWATRGLVVSGSQV
jgi:hypothetical protein